MQFLADESVDAKIVSALRDEGIIVSYIAEDSPGISDIEVLAIASTNNLILITEDKDFGEIVNRTNPGHVGVLLIRLHDLSRHQRIEVVKSVFTKHQNEFRNSFSVLSKNRLRIKKAL